MTPDSVHVTAGISPNLLDCKVRVTQIPRNMTICVMFNDAYITIAMPRLACTCEIVLYEEYDIHLG